LTWQWPLQTVAAERIKNTAAEEGGADQYVDYVKHGVAPGSAAIAPHAAPHVAPH
jgi:hypothetical protein